jgi:hypothetical protein
MRPGKIYTLTNPVGNILFYVGSTNVSLGDRLSVHVWNARNRPMGGVGRYISKLTLKPFIEELESFESISDTDLRSAELFWIRQLKYWGFNVLNDNMPISDKQSLIIDFPIEDVEYLKEKIQYVQVIRVLYNIRIGINSLYRVIDTKKCKRDTYYKVQSIINLLKSLDYTRVYIEHRMAMVTLTDDNIKTLNEKLKGRMKDAIKITGFCQTIFFRLRKYRKIRIDKMPALSKLIGPVLS